MRNLFLFAFFLVIATPVFTPAFAMTQEEAEHARSAFLFAGRKDWNEAMLHAKRSNDDSLQTLVTWQYLLAVDSNASFAEITQFIDAHPDFPEQKKLRIRAENALPNSGVSNDEIIEFFSKEVPITGNGKFALAKALENKVSKVKTTQKEQVKNLVREAWAEGDFDETQEKLLLENYGSLLKKEDDIARTDRLLWEGKNNSAERMFVRVGEDRQKLYKARMALQGGKKDAIALLTKVPSQLKNDVGLLYDRICFRAKKDDERGVLELLLIAPKQVPYPEKWWKYREPQIRTAIDDEHIALAKKLLDNHGQKEGQDFTQGFAEASWLKGYMLLKYLKKPQDAYAVFYKMFATVKYPVSKARAAYWAARAAKSAGDEEAANSWLNTATAYPSTFYGQVASLVYRGNAPLRLPAQPIIDAQYRQKFAATSIAKSIKLCFEFDAPELAGKLINNLAENSDNKKDATLASEFAVSAGKNFWGVRAAKKALQNNNLLITTGYPLPQTPENLALPTALALAITRQESEFDRLAKSPSGAMGLMQLLPSTAKETAQKNNIEFTIDRLYEPEYNMSLGSLYLSRLIGNYDGKIIMAIAAYNAGGGNVHKWVQKFGRPENSIDGAIDWIEKIPFSETRNYVQRVLENLQIYRHIEAINDDEGTPPKLFLGNDLLGK